MNGIGIQINQNHRLTSLGGKFSSTFYLAHEKDSVLYSEVPAVILSTVIVYFFFLSQCYCLLAEYGIYITKEWQLSVSAVRQYYKFKFMDFSSQAKYIKSIPSKIHENDIAEWPVTSEKYCFQHQRKTGNKASSFSLGKKNKNKPT